ncbi:serine hydrolase [Candidatus Uhrbacteria bacterium]|nr:serine hydrolase [Candidatus Uhrbacteria bacterium]
MLHRTSVAVAILVGALLPASCLAVGAPVKSSGAMEYARSDGEFAAAVVMDAATRKVLYEYRADAPRTAASLTKLMGALVFIDHRPRWNAVVSITKADEVGGGRLRVASGASMTALDLFYSSVTASANNAATAMARVSGLGMKGFVKAMNARAKAFGLTNTTFVDPSGMDPKNMTTARDMAVLALKAFETDPIRRSATTAKYGFTIRNSGERKVISNTNDLLTGKDYDDLYVTGGKTGFLYESMYNLAVRVRPSDDEDARRTLMVVILGSPTRTGSFESADGLARWAWKAYRW